MPAPPNRNSLSTSNWRRRTNVLDPDNLRAEYQNAAERAIQLGKLQVTNFV